MAAAPLSLTARALRLLAQREHSRLELERKLQRFVPPQAQDTEDADGAADTGAENAPPEDLAAVLDRLEAKGFIQPERVAQSVLYRRAPKLGSQRVLQELRQKGLDEAIVRQAADTLRQSEHQRAWTVWQRKFGQLASTPQERARQMRFLASRGFAMEVIAKVVRGTAPTQEE
ncbi:Regulatory protein RecX [uncultured Comamonas sp.]|nr:Regulatory protein RecX [uncultured Comamonas sp.]